MVGVGDQDQHVPGMHAAGGERGLYRRGKIAGDDDRVDQRVDLVPGEMIVQQQRRTVSRRARPGTGAGPTPAGAGELVVTYRLPAASTDRPSGCCGPGTWEAALQITVAEVNGVPVGA